MPRSNLRMIKQRLRKTMIELRNKQPIELVSQKSDQIVKKLLNMAEYKRAKIVMLYSGKGKEVQTEKLIKIALKEKRVVLPITNVEKRILELSEIKDYDLELKIGTFNILEPKKEFIRPIEIDSLDLIVVPGVSFDYRGNRLGYGYAYYDKLLATVRRRIPFIGLAFHFQLQHRVPHSRYDIPMHFVITEKRIIKCR